VPEATESSWLTLLIETLGITAALVFYGRFYLQWIVSEIKGRSVVPVAFWYMSVTGSLCLLAYGALIQSPVGVLSHTFNMVIYTRNLIHIWRGKGALSAQRYVMVHGAVAVILLASVGVAGYTWIQEYNDIATRSDEEQARAWFWIAIGVVGQALFGARFLVQWIATEVKKKSHFPISFWYLSFGAAGLLVVSHVQQREWVFAAGVATTVLIYARNIWLIHAKKEPMPPAT